jgi:hypothetical protein
MRPGAIGTLLICIGQTACERPARISVNIEASGNVVCSEATTPQPWSAPDVDSLNSEAMDTVRGGFEVGVTKFEVRKGSRLLLGIYAQYSDPKYYSKDHYAFIKDNERLGLRPVTETEWEGASVSQLSESGANGKLIRGQPLSFQNRVFAPSGSYWLFPPEDASRVTQDGNYLVLHSWSGIIQTDLTVKTILEGSYFVDVFEVATARRVAKIFGDFSGFDPQRPLSRAVWIDSETYIVPLTEDLRRLLICNISKRL